MLLRVFKVKQNSSGLKLSPWNMPLLMFISPVLYLVVCGSTHYVVRHVDIRFFITFIICVFTLYILVFLEARNMVPSQYLFCEHLIDHQELFVFATILLLCHDLILFQVDSYFMTYGCSFRDDSEFFHFHICSDEIQIFPWKM